MPAVPPLRLRVPILLTVTVGAALVVNGCGGPASGPGGTGPAAGGALSCPASGPVSGCSGPASSSAAWSAGVCVPRPSAIQRPRILVLCPFVTQGARVRDRQFSYLTIFALLMYPAEGIFLTVIPKDG